MIRYLICMAFLILQVISATTTSPEPSPIPTPSTIIDILSSQAQYSYFLRQIQRNGLIPIINRLENVTLLAPINLAYSGFEEELGVCSDIEVSNGKGKHDLCGFNTLEDPNIHLNDLHTSRFNHNLLRYIVDQRFRIGYLKYDEVIYNSLYKSLEDTYFPIKVSPSIESQEYIINDISAIVDPDIYSKHQRSFVQGIEKLIPLKPTICDILLNDFPLDLGGSNITFIKRLFELVFKDEEDGGKKNRLSVYQKKSKHKFNPVFPKTCQEFLNHSRTVLIPTDDYIKDSLLEFEQSYYTSLLDSLDSEKYSTTDEAIIEVKNDIFELMNQLLVLNFVGGVNGTTNGRKEFTQVDLDTTWKFRLNHGDQSIIVNEKIQSFHSELLSNGIIHFFKSQYESNFFKDLMIKTVEMIPRKALFGLHFSGFVEELDFRSLSALINGSTTNQTIFVDISQRDDYVEEDEQTTKVRTEEIEEIQGREDELTVTSSNILLNSTSVYNEDLFHTSSFSSKQSFLYQFANEPFNLSQEQSEGGKFFELLNSKLCSNKRIGGCYKLKVSATQNLDESRFSLNDEINIISDMIPGGNQTMIYLADSEISPPSNFKNSLGDLMSNGAVQRYFEHIDIDRKGWLHTLEYLNQFKLLSLDDNNKGYTVFLPCGSDSGFSKNDAIEEYSASDETRHKNLVSYKKNVFKGAWKELGLVLKYLEYNPKLFKSVLKGLFVEDTIYSHFGLHNDTSHIFPKTLRGDTVEVKSSHLDGEYSHIIKFNHTELSIPLNSDILFNQGVIHIINEVLLPENFEIPFIDLIGTTVDESYPQHSIIDLIELYPKLRHALFKPDPSFSLLVPSAESLKDFNITTDYSKLFDFLEFHLIPNDSLLDLLNCVESDSYSNSSLEYIIRSNLSNTEFTCHRSPTNGKVFLKMTDSRWVKNETSTENTDFSVSSYNKDHEVRILSHGCSSFNRTHESTNGVSCVFLLEKPFNLEWLEKPKRDFKIHLGFVSVGVGIILGLLMFGAVLIGAVLCLGNTNKNVKNQMRPHEFTFPTNEPSYMQVLGNDEHLALIDRGYETDVDVLREHDPLLPLYGRKKFRKNGYGSIPSIISPRETTSNGTAKGKFSTASAPRTIKGSSQKGLNRERNIPGF